jgi:hypothetical protein
MMINKHGIIGNKYKELVKAYAQYDILRASFTKQVRM